MYYEDRFKELLVTTAKGFGIGLVISIILTAIMGVSGAAVFSGMALSLSEGGSVFWAITFTWNAIKASVGMMILAAILVFEFVIFPITTIYYFAKSRQELTLA